MSSGPNCGWCDGNAFVNGSVPTTDRCIDPSVAHWSCDGTFKSAAECDCAVTGAPDNLMGLGILRGLRIDATSGRQLETEIALQRQNETVGSVTLINANGRTTGTITSIVRCRGASFSFVPAGPNAEGVVQNESRTTEPSRPLHVAGGPSFSFIPAQVGCDRTENNPQACSGDQIFMSFNNDNQPDLQCTYRLDWQSGPDARYVAMGCNTNGLAPACFDGGDQLFSLWACLDASTCPFKLAKTALETAAAVSEAETAEDQTRRALLAAPWSSAEYLKKATSEADRDVRSSLRRVTLSEPAPAEEGASLADECSGLASCDACMAVEVCGWCIGSLFNDDTGEVDTGAHCFPLDEVHECAGTTLTDTCTVYKCPWYNYFDQAAADQGDCSALACSETQGDDPDFSRTDTPAQAYSTADACAGNCVDPTTGCEEDTCVRTYTCNASSTCSR